jgi:hypothetical protein
MGQANEEEMGAKDAAQMREELAEKEERELAKAKRPQLLVDAQEEEERKVDVTLLLKNRPEVDEQKLSKYDDKDDDDNDAGKDNHKELEFR